jgi:hypothetical protein
MTTIILIVAALGTTVPCVLISAFETRARAQS